jgi:phosphoglycolate phosphatase
LTANRTYALYVFDLDGTLVDSRRDLSDAANELLRECGAPPLPEDEIGRMVGDGAAVLVARVFAARGLTQPPHALPRFLAIYDGRLLNHTRAYPGIAEALDAIALRARRAVLTNKPLAATRRILDGLDLARYFPADDVIGGDGPFPRKPDPAGLQHLAGRAGAPLAATLHVGDSIIDLRTARQAGTAVCLARYGFGYETIPREELRPADRVIDAPSELPEL